MATGVWNWFKGLFGFENTKTDDAEVVTKPGGIGGMLLSLITGVWGWFKGLFGWGDSGTGVKPAESEDSKKGVKGFLLEMVSGIWEYFKGLFDFSSFGAALKTAVKLIFLPYTILFDMIDGIWTWLKGLFGFSSEDADKDPRSGSDKIIDFMVGIVANIWTWVKGLFSWGTQGTGADEEGDVSLVAYIKAIPTKIWSWFKGLFSWGTDDETAAEGKEGFSLTTVISGVFTSIKDWFNKLFKFDSAGDVVKSIANVLTFVPNIIKDLIGSVTEWLLDLFGFGDAAKAVANINKFSIGDLIFKAVESIAEWFKGLFDIDWAQAIKDLAPAWVKDVPIIGKWFGGGDVTSETVGAAIAEHGQTLKAATEADLYDKDRVGASELNREALTLGVQSGQVQKEMLQAIIDDKDLRDEDLEFMKQLVERATTPGSLFVHDMVVASKLDALLGKATALASLTSGADFARNAALMNAANAESGRQGGANINNNMPVVVNAPSQSAVAHTKVETAIGLSDPYTHLERAY